MTEGRGGNFPSTFAFPAYFPRISAPTIFADSKHRPSISSSSNGFQLKRGQGYARFRPRKGRTGRPSAFITVNRKQLPSRLNSAQLLRSRVVARGSGKVFGLPRWLPFFSIPPFSSALCSPPSFNHPSADPPPIPSRGSSRSSRFRRVWGRNGATVLNSGPLRISSDLDANFEENT